MGEMLLDWGCLMVLSTQHIYWALTMCWVLGLVLGMETGRNKLPSGACNPLGRGSLKPSNQPCAKTIARCDSCCKGNNRQREWDMRWWESFSEKEVFKPRLKGQKRWSHWIVGEGNFQADGRTPARSFRLERAPYAWGRKRRKTGLDFVGGGGSKQWQVSGQLGDYFYIWLFLLPQVCCS